MADDSYAKMKIELDFLSAIERGEVTTQMNLKQRVGVSVGLINALLKRAVNKGYVKVKQAPYKRYAYYLTPQGFAEKSRLVAAYLESSMDFLRQARVQYAELFDAALARKQRNIVLAGAGELAEIALLATLGKPGFSLSIYIPDDEQADSLGLPVVQTINDMKNADLIVMTDSRQAQETYEMLSTSLPGMNIIWPALLHITPDRAALVRRQEADHA